MHIPGSMLNGAVCPVTTAVAVAGTGLAVYYARKADEQPSPVKFASVTAMVFALQMLNFTVQNGTSGHLMGSVLAMSLLGVPYAVISMAVVLVVQSVFFGDGGINALGANIINMSFIGVGGAAFVLNVLKKIRMPGSLALAITAWVSLIAAATACSLEVAWAGAVGLGKVVPAMLSVHAIIGIGEIAVTLGVMGILSIYQKMFKAYQTMTALAAFALAVAAALFSPFASNFPDGLEYVSEKLGFITFPAMDIGALCRDYQVPFITHEGLSTVCAGLMGVMIVFVISHVMVNGVKLAQGRK